MIAGETLRMVREQRGWDQQTLAQRAGIDPSVVSRLERGLQNDLKVSVLVKLAKSLDVPLDVLVTQPSGETSSLSGELAALLPVVQLLPIAYQRQVAAIVRGYITNMPSDDGPAPPAPGTDS